MFDIGGGELIVIVLAILVLFGPKKIPELARMFSKGMQQVRKAQAQIQTQMVELQRDINIAAGPPPAKSRPETKRPSAQETNPKAENDRQEE